MKPKKRKYTIHTVHCLLCGKNLKANGIGNHMKQTHRTIAKRGKNWDFIPSVSGPSQPVGTVTPTVLPTILGIPCLLRLDLLKAIECGALVLTQADEVTK